MEVQVYGTINAKEDFQLKLRAAGACLPETFSVEESVWMIPSVTGAVQGQIRLFPSSSPHTTKGDDESWTLSHEAEIIVDKEDIVRVVNLDRVELRGKAPDVLKHLGFTEGFRIGRQGMRVQVPGGWIIECFTLFDPTQKRTNPRKRTAFVLEKGSSANILVTMKRSISNEKDTPALVMDAWRLIRRLTPELQPATWLSMMGRKE